MPARLIAALRFQINHSVSGRMQRFLLGLGLECQRFGALFGFHALSSDWTL